MFLLSKVGILGNLQIAKESLSIFEKLIPQDIKLKVSSFVGNLFSNENPNKTSIIPKIERPVNKNISNSSSSKVINIPKIIIHYSGDKTPENVGKEVANEVILSLEEFLERY